MPLVTSAADAEFGLAKQTNEATIPTVATYASPIFSGLPNPTQSTDRVEVTDADNIVGDPFKTDEHWEADTVIPAWNDMLGTALVGMFPTDTTTGAGPYTHTYSLAGTIPFLSMYTDKPGTLKETFEAGVVSGLGFTVEPATSAPLRANVKAYGKRPTVATYTVTTSKQLSDGFFTGVSGAAATTLKIEVDNATPVTVSNIQTATITIDRPVESVPTADAIFPSYLSQGKLEVGFSMDLIWSDWDAYRATFYGSASGSTPSGTLVTGSLEFTFPHSVTATHSLKLTIPQAVFVATAPDATPAGGPFTLSIEGFAKKNAGNPITPVLVNSVSTTY